MAIFSRKNKSKPPSQTETTSATSNSTASHYRHVPRHALSDAAVTSVAKDEQQQQAAILAANKQRLETLRSTPPAPVSGSSKTRAYNATLGTTAPSSFEPHRRPPPTGAIDISMSGAYTTDPEAPPMPNVMPKPESRHPSSKSNVDYFSSTTTTAIWSDGAKSMSSGSPRIHPAHRDCSPVNHAQRSSDSGYESAGTLSAVQSRIPSEIGLPADAARLPKNSDILAEMNARKGLPNMPFTTARAVDDNVPPEVPEGLETAEEVHFSSCTGPVISHFDDESGSFARSIARSISASRSKSRSQAASSSPPERRSHRRANTAEQIPRVGRTMTKASRVLGEDVPITSEPSYARRRTSEHPRVTFSSRQNGLSSLTTTYSALRADASAAGNTSTPSSELQDQNAPGVPSSDYRAPLLPPLSVLEGFKVNRRGTVLDEEGDTIGELKEGDILDCVRQKVNCNGEVVDEYGAVVGLVRTVPRVLTSPKIRISSPSQSSGSQSDKTLLAGQRQVEVTPDSQPKTPSICTSEDERPDISPQNLSRPQERQARSDYELTALPQTGIPSLDIPFTFDKIQLGEPPKIGSPQAVDLSEGFAPPFTPSRSPMRDWSPSSSATSTITNESIPQSSAAATLDEGQSAEKHVVRHWASRVFESEPAEVPSAEPESEKAVQPDAATLQPLRQPSPPSTLEESKPEAAANDAAKYKARDSLPKPNDGSMFSYKGEIPAADAAPSRARAMVPPRRINRTESLNAAPSFKDTSSSAVRPAHLRHLRSASAAHVPTISPSPIYPSNPKMALATRNSFNQPMKRSPLASLDSSIAESFENDLQSFEDDPVRKDQRAGHARQSMPASSPKPRTYFTHAGKVSAIQAEQQSRPVDAKTATAAVDVESVKSGKSRGDKSRSRFSLGLGRKS